MTNATGDASSNPSSDKNVKQISDFRKNMVYSVNISAQTNDKILIFFFRRSSMKSSTKIV